MLRPGRLIPEPSSGAVLVAGRAVATPPASRVTASVTPSVCGADTWHVGPLGHHLRNQPLRIHDRGVSRKRFSHRL